MRRQFPAALGLALLSAGLVAAGPKPEGKTPKKAKQAKAQKPKIQSQDLSYKVDGKSYQGYMASANPKAPLVLIIHDWDGLTEYEKKRSAMLAKLGYSVFCLDMFGQGVRPETVPERRKLTGALYKNRKHMRALMNGGLKAAKDQGLNTDKAVIMGYCFGGTCVLEFAKSGAPLKGFVTFHGGLSLNKGDSFKGCKGKIAVFHGTADKHVTMQHFADLANLLEKEKVAHEMITFSGAPHAFSVFGSDRYRKHADQKSWALLLSFLKEQWK